MGTTEVNTSTWFRFGILDEIVEGDTVLIRNNHSEIVLQRNASEKELRFLVPPPQINGQFEMIFSDQYHPLVMYFDRGDFFIPQYHTDGTLKALTILSRLVETTMIIFPFSPDRVPGSVVIRQSESEAGIGLVIVGTSGLTEPYNY